MICNRCGYQDPVAREYCTNCGAKIDLTSVEQLTALMDQKREERERFVFARLSRLLAGAVALLRIPAGRWVRFEVDSTLGDSSGHQFDLRVWLPDRQAPHVFEGLPYDERFRRLDWVGFVARTEQRATCFVDNIEVRPEE